MQITGKEYEELAKQASDNSPIVANTIKAFLVGGLICTIGEVFATIYKNMGMSKVEVKAAVPITLIVITAFLTGIGVFDKIARQAGAGTIVPITGFANSMVSPALEFKAEGHILGTAAQMFTIAGPVIVYGISTAFLYGLIIWIFKLF